MLNLIIKELIFPTREAKLNEEELELEKTHKNEELPKKTRTKITKQVKQQTQ